MSLFEEVHEPATADVPTRRVTVTVNGQKRAADVEPRLLLAHLLRQGFRLTGTHTGCDTSNCGACTVLFDGKAIKSCTMLAVQADGHELRTVESLAEDGELNPLQRSFHENHGLQCGFCTAGILMAVTGAAEAGSDLEETIENVLPGHLCRCTGYVNIRKSIRQAWPEMTEGR